jgi:hypothetical protein
MSDENEPDKDLRVLAGTRNPRPKFTRHDKILAFISGSPFLLYGLLNLLPLRWRLWLIVLVIAPVVLLLAWYWLGRVTGRIQPPTHGADLHDTEAKQATEDFKPGR